MQLSASVIRSNGAAGQNKGASPLTSSVRPRRVPNLKAAVFAGFVPAGDVTERDLALQIHRTLGEVARPLDDSTTDQFWSRLEERLRGANIQAAVAAGGDPRLLVYSTEFARRFGTQRFQFKRTLVGIDIFNAGGEFGIPDNSGNSAIELFRIDGTDADEFVDLAMLIFEAVNATFLFGASDVLTERYVRLRLAEKVEHVGEMLWPLTSVARKTGVNGVYRQLSSSKGNVIQVFQDLWTGQADMYQAAATDLGLRCFWSPELIRV